jgi:hypothetical protein
MARGQRIGFCGAFNGTVTLRDGETVEQALERVESAMLAALDARCKRLDINVGVDSSDYEVLPKRDRPEEMLLDPTTGEYIKP